MSSPRAACRLTLLLAAELAAAAGLLRLGSPPWLRVPAHDVPGWFAAAPVEDAAAACLRVAAIATLTWVLAGTALYAVARAARVRPAVRALTWVTPPPARRLVDRAVAVTLATSCAAGAGAPALAEPATPPPPGVAAPSWLAGRPAEQTPARDRPRPSLPPRRAPPAAPGPTGPSRRPVRVVHEVVAGDNLWALATRRVGSRDPAAVGPYWVRVVAANRDRIRSGDPDLIYPGERVVLPEPGVARGGPSPGEVSRR